MKESFFAPLLCLSAMTLLFQSCIGVRGVPPWGIGSPSGLMAPADVDPYFITGSETHRETLVNLFSLLAEAADEGPAAEYRFAIVREIANSYMRQKEYPRLINFLTGLAAANPDDPYVTYYLFMTAYAYVQEEAYPAAALYFDRIVRNYPDMTIQGESIHLACLNQLITLVDRSEQRVWYYEELITRFADRVDLGAAFFLLGQAYERIGEWNSAISAYTQFLPFLDSNVPGFPNAYAYARQLVDFNNSPKDWTFESLPALLAAVEEALDAGSAVRLGHCRAKVNFFARTWEQEEDDDAGMAEFNLITFMRSNRIHYADTLDKGSNAIEAYLRTTGWSQYISTWYLYFRKINFPADPEIHGRWEWAGVYYGEKF